MDLVFDGHLKSTEMLPGAGASLDVGAIDLDPTSTLKPDRYCHQLPFSH